ncbi:MAG: hypothetical protein KatS3mg091_509 [Patescibacteria group bacterium]|nr:MAG: hypothetical protein KatS3mg091_509 [Patescibacteria group bacterium]
MQSLILFIKEKKIYILVLFGIVFLLVAIFVITSNLSPDKKPDLTTDRQETERKLNITDNLNPEEIDKIYPFSAGKVADGIQVGAVRVYLEDINQRFKYSYQNTVENRKDPEKWQAVFDGLTDEIILQNEAVRKGIVFYSDNKFTPARANFAREYFETKGTTYLSGEAISVWFYNIEPPAMGVEKAKEITRPFIEDLRNQIASGSLTMKQAGEKIKANKSLFEIDEAYEWNAHQEFLYLKKDHKYFHDDILNDYIWKMEEGQLSPVLIGRDFAPEFGWYEAYYIVIKINEKKIQEFDSVEELIEARKKEGLVLKIE